MALQTASLLMEFGKRSQHMQFVTADSVQSGRVIGPNVIEYVMLGTFNCGRVVHQGSEAAGLSQQCTLVLTIWSNVNSGFALIISCVYDTCTLFTL